MLAILLLPTGLVLCLIHSVVVVYAVMLRAARSLIQQITRRVCRPAQGSHNAFTDAAQDVVLSVRVQGLQIEATGERSGGGWGSCSTDARKATCQSHQVNVPVVEILAWCRGKAPRTAPCSSGLPALL
jgi:hypothetical protein